jgi:hypothetical protein
VSPAAFAGFNQMKAITSSADRDQTHFSPDATLVYCEVCGSARVFEPQEVQQFAGDGWPRCCGEPVTLVAGAQFNRGQIPRLDKVT